MCVVFLNTPYTCRYPAAYCVCILPISITRWAYFRGHHIPSEATFFGVFLHDIFGAVNVLLLLTTRPGLLLFDKPKVQLNTLESGTFGKPNHSRAGTEQSGTVMSLSALSTPSRERHNRSPSLVAFVGLEVDQRKDDEWPKGVDQPRDAGRDVGKVIFGKD